MVVQWVWKGNLEVKMVILGSLGIKVSVRLS